MHAFTDGPALAGRTSGTYPRGVAGIAAGLALLLVSGPALARKPRVARSAPPAAPSLPPAAPSLPPAPPPPPSPVVARDQLGSPVPAGGAEARALNEKLQSLMARPGGLTADEVARRAEERSIEVTIRRAEIDSAAAQVDQAMVAFFPRLSGVARYTRLSALDPPTLGYLVGASLTEDQLKTLASQPDGQKFVPLNPCVNGGTPPSCNVLGASPFSFPILLNQTILQASLSVPLSDYVLRSVQGLAAAAASRRAALVNEQATRLKVKADARILYYNWARTVLQEVVTAQALAQVQGHLRDARHMLSVGNISPADVLRVESQAASAELVVERTHNLTRVMAEQLAIAMNQQEVEAWQIGEDLKGAIGELPEAGADPAPLVAEALDHRLEPRVLDENKNAIHEQAKVVRAGQYPKLDAFGDVQYNNPNQRIFPQKDEFRFTWDVGVGLSWSPNDVGIARANARNIDAQVVQLESQLRNLKNGLRAEVTAAWSAMREAQTEMQTTARGLQASEESYRVRQELWKVGRATAVELTDAETDLTSARLAAVNASIDLRVAAVKLIHALGRDIQK